MTAHDRSSLRDEGAGVRQFSGHGDIAVRPTSVVL